ncbi:hypothetical protein CEXT_142151 [Caerostris extrusa]|uniref:PAP-associated domain-containing protein n=1 Tax=Caerostris extrusa TaxID=172846 RepID=A0AAV4M7B1_CAEEX|nr:hypothetical protein CEXT_142151 [Caerostris extrusa]
MLMRDAFVNFWNFYGKTFTRYTVVVDERRLVEDRRNVDVRRFVNFWNLYGRRLPPDILSMSMKDDLLKIDQMSMLDALLISHESPLFFLIE